MPSRYADEETNCYICACATATHLEFLEGTSMQVQLSQHANQADPSVLQNAHLCQLVRAMPGQQDRWQRQSC